MWGSASSPSSCAGGDRRRLDGRAHPDEAHGERRRHAVPSRRNRSTPLRHGPAPRKRLPRAEADQAGRSSRSTPLVNVAPDGRQPSGLRPGGEWTVALVAGRAPRAARSPPRQAHRRGPLRIEGIQVDGGSEFRAESRTHAESAPGLSSCRRAAQLNGHVDAPRLVAESRRRRPPPASNRSSSASTPRPRQHTRPTKPWRPPSRYPTQPGDRRHGEGLDTPSPGPQRRSRPHADR